MASAAALFALTSGRAQSGVSGTPSGDISAHIDWNLTDPSGGPYNHLGNASGPLRATSDTVIGTFRGSALTTVSGNDVAAKALKIVYRTSNHVAVSNTTTLSTSASAYSNDVISFSGPGGAFSFTLVPVVTIATNTSGLNFLGGTDLNDFASLNLANFERNVVKNEAEVYFSGSVKNSNGTFANAFNQALYERVTTGDTFYTANGNPLYRSDYSAIASIDFNMTSGQSLQFGSSAYAYAETFSTVSDGFGGADATASISFRIENLTPGWTFTSASGNLYTASAVPEPGAFALFAGLGMLVFAVGRRKGRAV